MFTFDQLRGFVAVCEELNFGRAAARLSMTQPPLSRLMQKLEREVGARLLDRDSRGVALTAAGEVFLGEARRLLALADSAPALARRISEGTAGTLRIGFTAGSGYGVLPQLLNHLAAALPEVEIELYEMVSREQVDALLAHEIDLGLARPPFDPAAFSSRQVFREALVVALPQGHPLADTQAIAPEDLAHQSLILYSPEKARYFYDLVVGVVPVRHDNVVHTVSQILTMVWLVQAGRGVALVPRSAELLGVRGVLYRPIDLPRARFAELDLLWSKDTENPALAAALGALESFRATF